MLKLFIHIRFTGAHTCIFILIFQNYLPDDNLNIAEETRLPWYMKIQWLLFNAALPNTILVTMIYWSVLLPTSDTSSVVQRGATDWFLDIAVHGLNSVLMIVEHHLSDIPTRLLHVYQPVIYAVVYAIFSVVLWSQTGIVLYQFVLDWDRIITVGSMIGMLIYFLVFQFVSYLIHLRKENCCS